ncbi:MAG TPA: alpha-amylase family glycosyl hydrolase [Pantanalinema sp.]
MHWSTDAFIYHLYPLGCLGAPGRNDFASPPIERLDALHDWIDPLLELGIDTLFLGPVFESTAHGYDTADYFRVDRRLGTADGLARLSRALHEKGIRLVLDAVLNHVGRDFWAFKDVREKGQASAYRDWFHLDFSRASPCGDPFAYEGWNAHYDLVKLNVSHPEVRRHLFEAVTAWITAFDLDGLRLDAADVLDRSFQRDLARHCRALKPGFWLKGEVIHGDYRHWIAEAELDSVTNYEVYKGLYSSHNDRNYFELAHSLERQFGQRGIYRDLSLYTFADNHDVARIASQLRDPAHLYPLHLLLMTVPGIPSIYYGSEWGIEGKKGASSDAALRPALAPARSREQAPYPALHATLKRLSALRRGYPALRHGGYRALHVAHEQVAFARSGPMGHALVAVNAQSETRRIEVDLPAAMAERWVDVLNRQSFDCPGGRLELPLDACWGRILVPRGDVKHEGIN